jgi:hypothetical protein
MLSVPQPDYPMPILPFLPLPFHLAALAVGQVDRWQKVGAGDTAEVA